MLLLDTIMIYAVRRGGKPYSRDRNRLNPPNAQWAGPGYTMHGPWWRPLGMIRH